MICLSKNSRLDSMSVQWRHVQQLVFDTLFPSTIEVLMMVGFLNIGHDNWYQNWGACLNRIVFFVCFVLLYPYLPDSFRFFISEIQKKRNVVFYAHFHNCDSPTEIHQLASLFPELMTLLIGENSSSWLDKYWARQISTRKMQPFIRQKRVLLFFEQCTFKRYHVLLANIYLLK